MLYNNNIDIETERYSRNARPDDLSSPLPHYRAQATATESQ